MDTSPASAKGPGRKGSTEIRRLKPEIRMKTDIRQPNVAAFRKRSGTSAVSLPSSGSILSRQCGQASLPSFGLRPSDFFRISGFGFRAFAPSQFKQRITFTVILLLFTSAAVFAAAPAQLTAAQTEFFENRIRPVLSQNCYKCHSTEAAKVKGQLFLDSRE